MAAGRGGIEIAPSRLGPPDDAASTRSAGSRWTAVRAPLAAAAATLAATGVVALVDPHQPGHYPLCPLRALTGINCPLCGGLRATYDLAHGHVLTAASENLLLVLAAPVLAVAWGRWLWRSWATGSRVPAPTLTGRQQWALGAVLVAFTVARNTPWGAWLAP